MHWQGFWGLPAKHNTRHNEKHFFQNEQSAGPRSIEKQPRELIFNCISLTLIMFGGLGSEPEQYSHTTLAVKIKGAVRLIDAREVSMTGEREQSFEGKTSLAKENEKGEGCKTTHI